MKIKLHYISNFNFNNTKNNNVNKKIFCKNFIVFLMFLNFINNTNLSILFKPKFRKRFDILKAPYRFKMSKNQLYFSRFGITVSFYFYSSIKVIDHKNLIYFYKTMIKFFKNFEVNLCLQNSIKIFLSFKYTNNFLLNQT